MGRQQQQQPNKRRRASVAHTPASYRKWQNNKRAINNNNNVCVCVTRVVYRLVPWRPAIITGRHTNTKERWKKSFSHHPKRHWLFRFSFSTLVEIIVHPLPMLHTRNPNRGDWAGGHTFVCQVSCLFFPIGPTRQCAAGFLLWSSSLTISYLQFANPLTHSLSPFFSYFLAPFDLRRARRLAPTVM